MLRMLKKLLVSRSGATAIEYGLIVALLSLAIIGGVGGAANSLAYMWGDNNSRLNQGFNMHQ